MDLPVKHLCCVPRDWYVEVLTPNVMVLGGGNFGG